MVQKKLLKNDNLLKVFILSPHIDDAAFSLALTISKLAGNDVPITIINCFTITKWTAIHVENKEIETVSRLRKNEDVQFYENISENIHIINLDLLDAPLRNGYIFQNQPFLQNEWELIETLQKLLEQHVDGLLFCPLAIGNHIDHAIAKEAVLKLYRNIKVLFYEDLPYTFRINYEQTERHVKDVSERLHAKMISDINVLSNHLINKEKAIKTYKSQINDEICLEITSYLNNLGGERIWGEAENINLLKSILTN